MKPLLPEQVTADVRRFVDVLRSKLGSYELVVAPGWDAFAVACGARSGESELGATPLIVGPVETALAVVGHEDFDDEVIGFVLPAAEKPLPWKRTRASYLDPTLALWRRGWSPLAVERADVPVAVGLFEVVIGNARPTPNLLREPTTER